MPSKKQNNTLLRFTQENSERCAIINVTDSLPTEAEKKDDTEKPLYLKRI